MRPPTDMTEIIEGVRYTVREEDLIAGDDYWDGHNHERRGTNRFLYGTPKGNYYVVTLTQWQGQRNSLQPIGIDEAMFLWKELTERRKEYEEAFPGTEVEDA